MVSVSLIIYRQLSGVFFSGKWRWCVHRICRNILSPGLTRLVRLVQYGRRTTKYGNCAQICAWKRIQTEVGWKRILEGNTPNKTWTKPSWTTPQQCEIGCRGAMVATTGGRPHFHFYWTELEICRRKQRAYLPPQQLFNTNWEIFHLPTLTISFVEKYCSLFIVLPCLIFLL